MYSIGMRGKNACWHCEHFKGWRIAYYTMAPRKAYATASCSRDRISIPEPGFGCVSWAREPGSDDEPGCIDPAGDRHQPGVGQWSRGGGLA